MAPLIAAAKPTTVDDAAFRQYGKPRSSRKDAETVRDPSLVYEPDSHRTAATRALRDAPAPRSAARWRPLRAPHARSLSDLASLSFVK